MPSRCALAFAVLLALGLPTAGCGDDGVCGPEDAPADGIELMVDSTPVRYGSFTSSPNNDCPVAGAPTSLTLDGIQTSPAPSTPFHLTFCLPHPDDIGGDPIALSGDERIQVIDVSAELGDCRVFRDIDTPPSATMLFAGYCDDGLDSAGYAIELSGTLAVKRVCNGGAEEALSVTVTGRAAVDAL